MKNGNKKGTARYGEERTGTAMRLISAFLVGMSTVGCVAYTETEKSLTDQTRRGLQLLKAAQADHTALAGRVTELQRQRLDDAFDNDVRDAADLSPDWIIEHRKAYITGVDALHQQKAASTNAAATATRNLEAIEQSLDQLQRLQKARLRLEQNFNLEKDQ